MGVKNFIHLPWYFFKFLIATTVLLGTLIFANALLILAVVCLFSIAENQTTLLNNSNGIGDVLQSAVNFAQSIISTISNCVLPFKLAWNHFFEFIFALVRIATASNHVAFPNYPWSTRAKMESETADAMKTESYPADSRFIVFDIVCDVIVPMFETFLNFVLLVGNFLLDLLDLFLVLVQEADGIDFTFLELFVGLIINPFLDQYDPDMCLHPFTGSLGWPGAPLHCMGCSIPRPLINQDSTTKTNAFVVCYCGGDLHDSAYNLFSNCVRLPTVISFFTSLGGSILNVAEAIGSLETWKNIANTLWNGIQSVWSSIESAYDQVRDAICKLPFVCKILHIRSIPHPFRSGEQMDDPYVCSYDSRLAGGDPDPFCFYESEFKLPKLRNWTDAATAITSQWNSAFLKIQGLRQGIDVPPPVFLSGNQTREERRQMYEERFYQEGDESAVLQVLRITRIFISSGLQVWNTGKNVGPEHLIQRFREEKVQPHHIPIGLRKYMARAGLKPYTLPWEKAVHLDHERMHETGGSPKIRFASPPPINFFATILSTTASISWNGAANASAFINAILQTLASVGIMVVSIVIKLAMGWIQDIFPSAFKTIYIFNPLSGLLDTFSPLYSTAQTQSIPASVFTTAWGNFATIFNDIISSAIGVEIVHYIFTAASYLVLDPNNAPPYHPNITSVNAMLTVVFNCNPQAACFIVDQCSFGPCDCGNGTIITLDGYCQAPGRCKCFPLFNTNAGNPSTTIGISVQLDPASAGYVPKNIMWPFTNFGQGLWNCILSAWNGALPYLATTLIWNAVKVPIYTVALRYTVGWCKCCTGLTSFLMKLTLVLSPLAVAVNYTFFPAIDYCSSRSVFYCTAFTHFFRAQPTGFTDMLLFFMNIAPSVVGTALIIGMFVVPFFFFWMMLGVIALCGVDLFNLATYGVQHDLVTPGSKIKEE